MTRKVSLAVATNLSYPVLWLTLGVRHEWDKADKRQTRNFQRKDRHFQPHSAMKGAMKAHSNPIATIPVLALRLQIANWYLTFRLLTLLETVQREQKQLQKCYKAHPSQQEQAKGALPEDKGSEGWHVALRSQSTELGIPPGRNGVTTRKSLCGAQKCCPTSII